jgi:exopolyphosphatase/guanosine-5'-triphosphate,3'-diphosphate pyrophosphatase
MIATSASAAAIVCAANRITRDNRDAADRLRATRAQVRTLFEDLLTRDLAARRKVPGIGPRRAEIIVPGAAVYLAVLERFGLPAMHYSVAGVRDGIVADLALRAAGQERAGLSRDQRRAVEALARRFGVALPHARKVAAHAHALFMSLRKLHQLSPEWGRLLEAAALLRDAGHFVSATSHHKHSWYLVAHSDLAGFTHRERALVALLCRYHRKAMPGLKHLEFQRETPADQHAILRLTPLLRIADALDRGRDQAIESVAVEIEPSRVSLQPVGQRGSALETWAVERAAADFQTVYNLPLVLR